MLPPTVQTFCRTLAAPPRLVAHLALVHEAAVELTAGLRRHFPKLAFDADAVLFGAATHDLGKVLHPEELTGPGSRHEEDGPAQLERHGVPPHLARFARTHGAWSRESLPLEDLLVALADSVWKGERNDPLELVINRIAEATGIQSWEAFSKMDGVLTEIAESGYERLAEQATAGE
jgi:hypothetical protein